MKSELNYRSAPQPQPTLALGRTSVATLLMVVGGFMGCGPKAERVPFVGHCSYLLGNLNLSKPGSEVEGEFVMPDATISHICLVAKGLDVNNSEQAALAQKALQQVKLTLEMQDVKSAQAARISTLTSHDLGRFANWYEPDGAFVISPPLVNYRRGNPVYQRRSGPIPNAFEVVAGRVYRLLLRVEEPAEITNRVEVRMDFWGIQMR